MFAFHTFLNNFSNNLLHVHVFNTCLSLIMVVIYMILYEITMSTVEKEYQFGFLDVQIYLALIHCFL